MTKKDRIINDYFKWMTDMMTKETLAKNISYQKLFCHLHNTEFTYDKIPEDENRAEDGIYLRYRFILDSNYSKDDLDYLDGPCSILEMMVALALRCEENIMTDTRYGDRTSQWFWSMVTSLGLGNLNDNTYAKTTVSQVLETFIDRKYEPNGRGGLFLVKGHKRDFRNIEIWNQLYAYLNTIK